MAKNALNAKYLLTKAYDKTVAYKNKVISKSYYNKVSSKVSYLKKYIDASIENCNTIKYYSNKIAANYKSKNNSDYFYKIQNAHNNLVKNRKKARDKLFEISSLESAESYYESEKKRKLQVKKILENNKILENKLSPEEKVSDAKEYINSNSTLTEVDKLLKVAYPHQHKSLTYKNDSLIQVSKFGRRTIRPRDIDISSFKVIKETNNYKVIIKCKGNVKCMNAEWGKYDSFSMDITTKTYAEEFIPKFKKLLYSLGYN
ncbi:hypothetical protein [Polaribacter sp.]|uniref:hypothetical protein n=1 Tax=Polaribacter sp. TaxID=1920175 RepID=UPI003F6A8448